MKAALSGSCKFCGAQILCTDDNLLHSKPMCDSFKKAIVEESANLGISPNLSDHELSKDSVVITLSDPVPVTISDFAKFVDRCIKSGMKETHCVACGCYLLTRSDEQLCPPCREKQPKRADLS